jgi:hypothetical protein
MRLTKLPRYRWITAAVAATLLLAGAMAHAPGARGERPLSAGGVRAVPPAEAAAGDSDEVYALVDEVIGRAGARPRAARAAGDGNGDGAAAAVATALRGEPDPSNDRTAEGDHEFPWRRLPTVRIVQIVTGSSSPFAPTRAGPVLVARPIERRELPSYRPAPTYFTLGFSGAPPRTERIVMLAPSDPAGTPVPLEPTTPGVGGLPSGSGSPAVPEPTGLVAMLVAGGAAMMRRRR